MSRRAAVIGSGPAGIFAAWAAIHEGWSVAVYAPEWRRPAPGSAGVFLLHDDIGLPLRHAYVQVSSFGGDASAYRKKVYGTIDGVRTSFDSIGRDGSGPRAQRYYDGEQGIEMVWDILQTAEHAGALSWQGPQKMGLLQLENLRDVYEAVISTAPLDSLSGVGLPYVHAWVHAGKAPKDEAYMLYNAHPRMPWYRAAAAFGRFTLEYTEPAEDTVMVRKVVPCPSGVELPRIPGVLFTGRFGAWDKRKLSHHAYQDTIEYLREIEHGHRD